MQLTENNLVALANVRKVTANHSVETDDQLAIEEPLEIQLRLGGAGSQSHTSISVTMRTPGNDEELAVGFLFTEDIIQTIDQVAEVKTVSNGENTVMVTLRENEKPYLQKKGRNFYTTSSCGVCGKSSIDAIRTTSVYQHTSDDIQLEAEVFYRLHDSLKKKQIAFESTGGLHASALFDLQGNFIMLREDVGRHNALDKVIGTAVLANKLPLNKTILLLSGRTSFELIQKASMAGIKIVVAIGAPSSLAVQLANEFDITLIGFLRERRFNIYSAWQRVRE